MRKAYFTRNLLTFFYEEAIHLAEGRSIIEGAFRQTRSTWTGVFETPCGKCLLIEEGIFKEVQSA